MKRFRALMVAAVPLILTACAAQTPESTASGHKPVAPPSVTVTASISFDGNVFSATDPMLDHGDTVRQYFLPGETREHWTHLVELRIYALANRKTPGHMVEDMRDALYKRHTPDEAPSSMMYYPTGETSFVYTAPAGTDPTSGLVFQAYKFYVDAFSGKLICFHYDMKISAELLQQPDRLMQVSMLDDQVNAELKALPEYQE